MIKQSCPVVCPVAATHGRQTSPRDCSTDAISHTPPISDFTQRLQHWRHQSHTSHFRLQPETAALTPSVTHHPFQTSPRDCSTDAISHTPPISDFTQRLQHWRHQSHTSHFRLHPETAALTPSVTHHPFQTSHRDCSTDAISHTPPISDFTQRLQHWRHLSHTSHFRLHPETAALTPSVTHQPFQTSLRGCSTDAISHTPAISDFTQRLHHWRHQSHTSHFRLHPETAALTPSVTHQPFRTSPRDCSTDAISHTPAISDFTQRLQHWRHQSHTSHFRLHTETAALTPSVTHHPFQTSLRDCSTDAICHTPAISDFTQRLQHWRHQFNTSHFRLHPETAALTPSVTHQPFQTSPRDCSTDAISHTPAISDFTQRLQHWRHQSHTSHFRLHSETAALTPSVTHQPFQTSPRDCSTDAISHTPAISDFTQRLQHWRHQSHTSHFRLHPETAALTPSVTHQPFQTSPRDCSTDAISHTPVISDFTQRLQHWRHQFNTSHFRLHPETAALTPSVTHQPFQTSPRDCSTDAISHTPAISDFTQRLQHWRHQSHTSHFRLHPETAALTPSVTHQPFQDSVKWTQC